MLRRKHEGSMDWVLFSLCLLLATSFFTVTSIRSKRVVFCLLMIIGAVVGAYGQWLILTTRGESFFQRLGFALSGIIVLSLSFGALCLNYTFKEESLKKSIYPVIS